MTVALVSSSAIEAIYSDAPSSIKLSSGDVVAGAGVGWSNKDYRLVEVKSFVVPDGQRVTGTPSYALDKEGYVVETYDTEDIPAAPPPSLSALALAALVATDQTAIRCFKAGLAFPPEWADYVKSLRSIVRSGKGELPPPPSYPEGT